MNEATAIADTVPNTMRGAIPYIRYGGRAIEAIEFYTRAFGAAEIARMPDPGRSDRLMHARTVINGGALMLTDMGSEDDPAPDPLDRAHLQLVVEDGRAWWDRALSAGCSVVMPYERQFWGDDWGLLADPFGVQWAILQPGEVQAGAAESAVDAPHELTLRRVIDAPRAVVWRCWTEPELLKQWFCPKPWAVTQADFDLRPGGRMNTVISGPDGERMDGKGIWLEVDPMRRLVFTDSFTEGFVPAPDPFMTAEVLMADAPDGGTQLVWSARHADAEALNRHRDMGWEAGWNTAVDQLEALARSHAQIKG